MAVPAIGNVVGVGPAADPAYLAFLRGSGQSEEILRANVAARQQEIEQMRGLRRGGFANQLREQRGSIQDDFQDRGMFASGSRMLADANAIRDVGQRQAESELGAQFDINQGNRSMVEDIARMHQERAERGLESRDRVAREFAGAGFGY